MFRKRPREERERDEKKEDRKKPCGTILLLFTTASNWRNSSRSPMNVPLMEICLRNTWKMPIFFTVPAVAPDLLLLLLLFIIIFYFAALILDVHVSKCIMHGVRVCVCASYIPQVPTTGVCLQKKKMCELYI